MKNVSIRFLYSNLFVIRIHHFQVWIKNCPIMKVYTLIEYLNMISLILSLILTSIFYTISVQPMKRSDLASRMLNINNEPERYFPSLKNHK
jgi:hypothetical protein